MFDSILAFIDRHQTFIITTHDSPDADGIGAELVLALILKNKGKEVRIINSSPVPKVLKFIETNTVIEKWDPSMLKQEEQLVKFKNAAFLVMDACEEIHLGPVRELLKIVKEAFIIDHHEPKPGSKLSGFVDSSSSSASEIAIEFADFMNVALDLQTAIAAYTGIVFDTGSFSYPKTTVRTFKAAIKTLEYGVEPNYIYKQLMENLSTSAILLQKQALANLEFLINNSVALMILRLEDFEAAGADYEEVDNIVNIPIKARDVEVSFLIKEKTKGEYFCSLRSKGAINVSKIAQYFGGGGHVTASGFRSTESIEKIVEKLLSYLEPLHKKDNLSEMENWR